MIIILAQAFLYHACKDNKNTDKSAIVSNRSGNHEEGKTFIKAAAEGGIMEVELAKVAQKQASSPEVKKFAARMVTDHTRIYNDLKKLATNKHIILPITLDSNQTAQLNKLQEATGSLFDKKYVGMMVTSHEKAIRNYEIGAANRDPQVNEFASQKIDTLKTQLHTARSVFNYLVMKGH